MKAPRQVRIDDPSQPGEARRVVASLCLELGFNVVRTAEVCLVVTELATNLVKHTGRAGGDLIFSPIEFDGLLGLDILSLDQAGGIVNVSECLRDGYSTTGTTGGGLGAICRHSAQFDIYSALGKGTVLLARLWREAQSKSEMDMQVGSVCLPIAGEQECGDAWAMKSVLGSTLFMLVDGLGHGSEAAKAANLAVSIFKDSAVGRPADLLSLINNNLGHTRGAAVAIAKIEHWSKRLQFAGVGNILGAVLGDNQSFNLLSHNGTAGMNASQIKEYEYPWPDKSLLIMHSDGVATRWSLDHYPGLQQKHPALIAGVLFRDYHRVRDDSCILVARAPERNGLL